MWAYGVSTEALTIRLKSLGLFVPPILSARPEGSVPATAPPNTSAKTETIAIITTRKTNAIFVTDDGARRSAEAESIASTPSDAAGLPAGGT